MDFIKFSLCPGFSLNSNIVETFLGGEFEWQMSGVTRPVLLTLPDIFLWYPAPPGYTDWHIFSQFWVSLFWLEFLIILNPRIVMWRLMEHFNISPPRGYFETGDFLCRTIQSVAATSPDWWCSTGLFWYFSVSPPGKQVEELQDELTNLLFGQDQTSLNMTDLPARDDYQDQITSRRIAEEDLSEAPIAVRSF